MSLRIRRGTDAQRAAVNFDLGEIVWTTDTEKLYVGNGVTQGGVNIAKNLAGSGLQYNQTSGRLDLNLSGVSTDAIPQGSNNKYFSAGLTQDVVGPMFDNTSGNVVFTYNNVSKKITANVTLDGGLLAIQSDTTPTLGGNLTLNGKNIQGTGNINITGNITGTNFYAPSGKIIDDTGNITAAAITATSAQVGTITATTGLGANLSLNTKNIFGTGNINITGDILAVNTSVTGTVEANKLITKQIETSDAFGVKITTPGIYALTLNGIADETNGATLFINGARGTVSSPTDVPAGGQIGAIKFDGYNNNRYSFAAGMAGWYGEDATFTIQTLSNVSVVNTTYQFQCNTATTPLLVGQQIVISGTNTGNSNFGALGFPTAVYIHSTNGTTGFTVSASPNAFEPIVISTGTATGLTFKVTVAFPKSTLLFSTNNNSQQQQLSASLDGNGTFNAKIIKLSSYTSDSYPPKIQPPSLPIVPAITLSNVAVTGTGGEFSCNSNTLKIGGVVTITGALAGTGTISGYISGSSYYIISTNGSTTFTLSETTNGSGITTTAGSLTGLSYRLDNPEEGMMIFNSDTKRFVGYDGTGWVEFTTT